MAKDFFIRRARSTDIPRLSELLGILFSIEKDFLVDEAKQQKGLAMMLEDTTNRCIMVADMKQKIVGMCTAQMMISTAEGGFVAVLEDLVVDKEDRGKGIGKELLLSIQNWAVEKGAKRLQLLADRHNLPALEFYKRMNWNNTQLICLHKKPLV